MANMPRRPCRPVRGGRGTGERDWAGEQEPGRGAGGRGTGERDLAGEQETGRGAGGRGTGERDQAGEQVITQCVN